MLKSPFTAAAPRTAAPRLFVGRDAEIPQLARAFEAGQSIVLWGVGGIGKTALAHQIIARQGWRFGDPPAIAFHSCENGLGVDALLDSLPSQLPFAPTGQGLPPDERRAAVLASLVGRRVLLVVDNFETAADRETFLDFLAALPGGCLALITTREAVRCPGWLLLELKPLADPAAARLLAAHLPNPQTLVEQAAGAQALLQQTAGHPLAIELAAALTRDWPDLAALAAALASRRAQLADAALHGVPERLRSLEASLTLSFDRLPPAGQQALTALAVFYTPFSDAGAAAVTDLAPAAWRQTRDLLRTRSLLYQDGEQNRFHPLVRDFGLARLADPAPAQRRAAEFLTDRWQGGEPVTPQEVLAVPRHWLAAGDWRAAASAAAYLTGGHDHSLDRRGYWNEIAVVLRIVVELSPAGEAETVVDLWNCLSNVLRLAGDYTNALASAQRGLAVARQVGDRLGEANVLQAIGDVQQFRDDRAGALASYGQALDLFRQVGDRLGEANVLQAIGDVQQFRKEMAGALASYGQALDLFRPVGARLGEANVLLSLGDLTRQTHDYTQAWQYYTQAQQHYAIIEDVYSQARVLYRMGDALVEQQRKKEAIPFYEEAIARWRAIGMTDLVDSILLPRLQAAQ